MINDSKPTVLTINESWLDDSMTNNELKIEMTGKEQVVVFACILRITSISSREKISNKNIQKLYELIYY